jgi:two-component system copper resistance phosphate regulon response regulator CusR
MDAAGRRRGGTLRVVRILLVEDEPKVANLVARGLRDETYAVDIAADGDEGLYAATTGQYDLIILDVLLPRRDGYTLCRDLRAAGLRTPILMLTARDAVDDRVHGLDCGADDYLTKPFDFKELLARLRALLRRSTTLRAETLAVANLVVDTARHAVTRAGRAVSLTAKEYALLEFLVLNRDRVLGREQIAQHVWDDNFDPFSNTIDVHIKRLRAKIDAGATTRLIHTRRGEGYLLSAHPVAGDD